jgi:hypothetical protein
MSEHIATNPAPISRKQQAQTLCAQLEECLDANPYGGANPAALRQIETLGLHLKWTSNRFSEKVGSLLGWAAILYSSRKHRPWDTPHQSGAQAIAHFMRCDLMSIETILGRMEDCS